MDHREFQKLVQEALEKQNDEEKNESLLSENFSLSEMVGGNTQIPTSSFEIVEYSEKSIAVFGDTKPIKEELRELGGSYNSKLKYKEEKKPGYIFSKKREEAVLEYFRVKHDIQ